MYLKTRVDERSAKAQWLTAIDVLGGGGVLKSTKKKKKRGVGGGGVQIDNLLLEQTNDPILILHK